MPSEPTLDVEALLAPIAGANPAGQDVRYTAYDAIKEARRADEDLPQGEAERPLKKADWKAVVKLASDALTTKSKDLQIAVWLTEALINRHGFAGLRDGTKLIREVHERFWDSMYPAIEGSDLDYRVGPLNWLNIELPLTVKQVPITKSAKGETYSYLDGKEIKPDGTITKEQLGKAEKATPLDDCLRLYEDLDQSWQEVDSLAKTVDQRFGQAAPSLMKLKDTVDDCRSYLKGMIKRKGGTVPGGAQITPESDGSQAAPKPGGEDTGGGVQPSDRAEALRRLAEVAEFFRRTEPHSPVSFLVQRAVRWGEMPFETWLQEVINEPTVLARVRETLGIQEHEPGTRSEEATEPAPE